MSGGSLERPTEKKIVAALLLTIFPSTIQGKWRLSQGLWLLLHFSKGEKKKKRVFGQMSNIHAPDYPFR